MVKRLLAKPQHEGEGAVVRRSIGRFFCFFSALINGGPVFLLCFFFLGLDSGWVYVFLWVLKVGAEAFGSFSSDG